MLFKARKAEIEHEKWWKNREQELVKRVLSPEVMKWPRFLGPLG